jgi:hypothetical protein
MFSLGWREGFEKDSIIGITGISEKISQDPEGYKDLQAQVDDISRFVGKQFQALSRPLYEEVKSQHNKLHAPGLTPLFESNPD